MKQMTFLDLCSGIGGFRLGLETAGHKCIGYCEYDKFARASYEAMYDTCLLYTSSVWQRPHGRQR